MTTLIQGSDLSTAWLRAVSCLLQEPSSKAVNLVAVASRPTENETIRSRLDKFIAELPQEGRSSRGIWPVETVANTIFPNGLYIPDLGSRAAATLYRLHKESAPVRNRLPPAQRHTYFDRLVNWPKGNGTPVNQLAETINKLRSQLQNTRSLGSCYELALTDPSQHSSSEDEGNSADLRIYGPRMDRKKIMGFPCLSHISLTIASEHLHLTALYRNQDLLRRAYGNYLGLSRLADFIAAQVGLKTGELTCVATHAFLGLYQIKGLNKSRLRRLIADCKAKTSGGLDVAPTNGNA